MDAGFPRPFGRYTLLAELGRGGMGEVFAARVPGGLPGIEKRCVIKTVRASATRDREAIARFLDEARLVVRLSQRNICSVFDVGVVDDGTYYLAMDLVRGRDLRTVWSRVAERGELLPPALAVHIILEVLDGLHYAHELCDEDGQHLAVVHRDVSPQNIMVSFDGDVKLIDFGLAASTMKLEQTQAHIVLGKLGYLSPEQVRGERADARADVFSTAVVLYELLTGQRYYGAFTPALRSELIAEGRYAPPALARLDDALQDILRRALAGDRARRTQTAGQFAAELRAWARSHGAHGDPAALRALMRDLFDASRMPWELPSSSERRAPAAPPVEATEIGRPSFLDTHGQTTDEAADERGIRTELQLRPRLVPPSTLEAPSTSSSRPQAVARRRAVVVGVVAGLGLGTVAVVALAALVVRPPSPVLAAPAADVGADTAVASATVAVDAGGVVVDAGVVEVVDAGVVDVVEDVADVDVAVVDAGVTAPASPVAVVAPPSPPAPGRSEKPRRPRRDVEAALARLEGAAAPGTPPVVQLKVVREVCGAAACEATMDGSLADRVAACLRSCRASVRRRAQSP
jgi:serine/threonine protein kinase